MAADKRKSPGGPDDPAGSEPTAPTSADKAAPLRRTREKLDTALARYLELYDLAPVGYVTLDEDGLILDANLTAMQLFGASARDLDSQPLSRFVLREDRDVFFRHRREVFAVHEPRESELRLVRTDGTPFWARLHSIAARPENGEAPFCRTVLSDVTGRRNAEREKEESERRLRDAMDAACLISWQWEPSSGRVIWTGRLDEGTAPGSGGVINDPEAIRRLVLADDLGALIEARDAARDGGTGFEHEVRVEFPDGSTRWLVARGAFAYDPDGQPVRARGITQDVTARKLAETALGESVTRYRELVENLNDMIYFMGLDGTVEYVSPAVTTILGYQPEDLIGTTFTDIVHADDVDAIRDAFQSVLKGDLEPREYRLVDAQGELHWVRTSSRPLVKEGATVGLQGVLTDITERRRAQEALVSSERNFRETLENVHLIAVGLDTRGEITFINDFALRVTGWSREEVLGRDWFEMFLPPDRREEVREIFLHTLVAADFPPHYDNPIVTRDGEERAVHWSNAVHRDTAGRATGIFSLGEDLTDVAAAEKALRASEEKYRRLFTTMAEGFALHEILCDDAGRPVDYRFLDANPAFCRLTGLGPDVIGHTAHEALPGIDDFWIETYGRVARTGQPEHFEHSSPAIGKDFEVRAFSPEPGRFATVFLDVTERRRAEEERNRLLSEIRGMAARLAEVEEAQRKDFARELHDRVGQNLTALGLNLSVLRNRLAPTELARVGSNLDDAAHLVVETTNEVRQVMTELRPPMLDGYGLVAALEWFAGVFSERSGVTVTVSGSEPAPRLGNQTEMAVFRIVQEALTNVGKHAAAGMVEISVEEEAGAIRVTVADDGRGFAAAAPPASDRREGWGLAIMKERAMSIGGALHVASEPGRGTRIEIELDGRPT